MREYGLGLKSMSLRE